MTLFAGISAAVVVAAGIFTCWFVRELAIAREQAHNDYY